MALHPQGDIMNKHRRSSSDLGGIVVNKDARERLLKSFEPQLQKRGSVDSAVPLKKKTPTSESPLARSGSARQDAGGEDEFRFYRNNKLMLFLPTPEEEISRGTMTENSKSRPIDIVREPRDRDELVSSTDRYIHGSPGVPGKPSFSKFASPRGFLPAEPSTSVKVDSSTQTASDAATQTSDDSSSDIESPPPNIMINSFPADVDSPTISRRHNRAASASPDGNHRRSSSWDSPLVVGTETARRQSLGMLNRLIKEKREAAQREVELKLKKERQLLKETLIKVNHAQNSTPVGSPRLNTSPTHSPSQPSPRVSHSSSHHHRSKSDTNVTPLLVRAGMPLPPQVQSQVAGHIARNSSPRSDTLHSRSLRGKLAVSPTFTSLNLNASLLAPDKKHQELAYLEKQLETRHKQLIDKGLIPPNSPSATLWNQGKSISDMNNDELIMSLDDIEDEIEHIRKRTMDIQGQVDMLEKSRCRAPDPVSMMFGYSNNREAISMPMQKSPSPDFPYRDYEKYAISSVENRSAYPLLKPHLEKSPAATYISDWSSQPSMFQVPGAIRSSRSAFSPMRRLQSSSEDVIDTDMQNNWGLM